MRHRRPSEKSNNAGNKHYSETHVDMTPTEAKKRYADKAKAFKRLRKDHCIPLRELAKHFKINHCVIHRFEHQNPISAVHFIQLEGWVSDNQF